MTGPRSLVELARAPGQDPALLDELASSGTVEVRSALASNPDLPADLALRLAKDRSVKVRVALAERAVPGSPVVERLVRDRAAAVRAALLHALLVRVREPWLRGAHGSAVARVAERLSHDPDPSIRGRCAALLLLPPERHEALAHDDEPSVRRALASNLRVERTLLDQLAEDREEGVATAALANPFTSLDVVQAAADSPKEERRAAAAANPMLSPRTACALLRDPELMVAAVAAGNPRVPLRELEELRVTLPPNPPSHRGAKKPYAPTGSLVDYVEDRLARHAGFCRCGAPLATERFEWTGPVLDARPGEEPRSAFFKAWCQGDCAREWRLDLLRRTTRREDRHEPLVLFNQNVTEDMLRAGEGLIEAPDPPSRYAPFLEPFSALEFDPRAGLPVVWGFPIAAWVPQGVVDAIAHDVETLFLGADDGQGHALRCLRTGVVAVELRRDIAASIYGPYGGDEFEDRYGISRWRGVRFGEVWFSSARVEPLADERDAALADWGSRLAAERAGRAADASARAAASVRDAARRAAEREARARQALELLGGPASPPDSFADCLGRFGPVIRDPHCDETVAWGFPIERRISAERWQELGRLGELVYVGDPPGLFQRSTGAATWVLVARSLTRAVAVQVYGPVAAEERGPRGGWRSVTLGETTFASRRLADPSS